MIRLLPAAAAIGLYLYKYSRYNNEVIAERAYILMYALACT